MLTDIYHESEPNDQGQANSVENECFIHAVKVLESTWILCRFKRKRLNKFILKNMKKVLTGVFNPLVPVSLMVESL